MGRDTELGLLVARVADDLPTVVSGEAGVGKTALLTAAARAAGRRLCHGGALSTLSWIEHLPLERALGRPVEGADAAAVAMDVVGTVTGGLLVLDDLQWADSSTAQVVPLLVGRVPLLVSVRTGDPGTDVALAWLSEAGFARVDLGPLDSDAATTLVRTQRPDLSETEVGGVLARAGGNPLLLRQLAEAGEPSPSLRLSVAARLSTLSDADRRAFELLALAGRPLPPSQLGGALGRLLEARLVTTGDEGVEVQHALLGEVAVQQLEETRRVGLHTELADLVGNHGEAARHHLAAGDPERALAAALRAADSTERPGERASHLALAAQCAAGPGGDDLRLRAARAQEEAHDWEALVATLAGLTSEDAEVLAWAELLRARGAWAAGDSDLVRTSITRGLELVDGRPSRVGIMLRIEESRIPTFLDGDFAAGVRLARAALHAALDADVEVARAHYLLGTAMGMHGQAGWQDELDLAIEVARRTGDIQTEFLAANNAVAIHESSGTPDAGRDVAAAAIARARELGLALWETALAGMVVNLDFHAGAYDTVVAEGEALLRRPLDARARDMMTEVVSLALVDLGRFEQGDARLRAAETAAAQDRMGQGQLTWVRAEAALWRGDPTGALALSTQHLGGATGTNRDFGVITHAWACAELGRSPEHEVPEGELPLTQAVPSEVHALRRLVAGDHDEAAEAFSAAAVLWAGRHLRGHARCRWAAAESLRRAGSPEAVDLLMDVEKLAVDHGMVPLAGRVRRSLRAAGVRRAAPRTTGPRSSALTDRELEVLGLVGAGLTNEQIASRLGLTRRTVETQLASASLKLGAATSRQAAALVGRPGPAPDTG